MKTFFERSNDARLADARLPRNEHHLTLAGLGARPAAQQPVDFFVATDEGAQRRSVQRLEPARNATRPQHMPSPHRLGDALDLDGAKVRYSKRSPVSRCVPAPMTTVSGSATPFNRAATYGVSPMIDCP